jgi:hypothetical protein
MPSLFKAIQAAFEANQWAFEQVPDREVLQASFEAHHTRVVVHVQAFEPIGGVHVVATSPYTFESYHLLKLSELLMRASQSLTVGNFEMVWDQRQVLFRATNLFDQKQSFPQTILQSLVHAAVAEMDRLTPLLAEVHKNDPASVLLLDITRLLLREDWLPPVSIDEP